MTFESLDVGCGNHACGSVNCDITIQDSKDRGYIVESIDYKKIPNFIICDAMHLPFKNGSFQTVVCKQVIEHVNNPSLLFSELIRVSKSTITVETTHFRAERLVRSHLLKRRKVVKWHQKQHVNFFSFKSFNRAINLYHCKLVKSYTLSYLNVPNNYISILKLPFEIGVEFRKEGEKNG